MKKNKIELLDCQIELLLHSLEMYSYVYEFAYCQKGKEEERNVSLILDTYQLILEETNSNYQSINKKVSSIFNGFERKLKNF